MWFLEAGWDWETKEEKSVKDAQAKAATVCRRDLTALLKAQSPSSHRKVPPCAGEERNMAPTNAYIHWVKDISGLVGQLRVRCQVTLETRGGRHVE